MIARNAVFQVYPAIDVRGGRVVRLAQGDYARETPYAQEPLPLAQAYAAVGAAWLHLVDLDAARAGGYTLSALLRAIKTQTGLSVQTGGGVRDEGDVDRLFAAGADRIVVGSLSANEPERVAGWLRSYGQNRITVALDARRADDGRWFPATHGWTRQGERSLADLVRFYARNGLRHLLCTDIARDGMLSGPNFDLYALLRQWAPQIAVQASGGARDIGDVREARRVGCAGIVLGKSLLEGSIELGEALAC
ncbi:MAG TPA: 1-(5-phosphoribosyl)-5-[(5-phosphoribosylamino)methylideneamino] imidazole-4-carboxamide isomerase [Luteimonas sp.]|nr:1-(5-phosphoribosyl)-5-[(5-phosphoribosylamino)methylideneamino] imidazole-4-carboxamide isomerase [Luteimonas sp.]